jgi:hypothetical protein
VSDEESRND